MLSNLINESIKDTIPEMDKWTGAKYENIKRASLTAKGKFGEKLAVAIAKYLELDAKSTGAYTGFFDIFINEKYVEVKTATLDVNGNFQFNGVRKVRKYDYILFVGVCYDEIVYEIYDKKYIMENCHLTRMDGEQDGNGSFKLTLKKDKLLNDKEFCKKLKGLFNDVN